MPMMNAQDLSGLLLRTLNHVDTRLVDHGVRVAHFVASMLRLEGRVSPRGFQDLCFLALLHDVGAFKTEEIDKMVQFETVDVWNHAIYGYLFLRDLSPLRYLAPAILFHHLDYSSYGRLPVTCGREAQLIFVADRADILLQTTTLSPAVIRDRLRQGAGRQFDPAVVELFLQADEANGLLDRSRPVPAMGDLLGPVEMSESDIETYLRMLAFTVDFRSTTTVAHTVTTTDIALSVARLMHLDEPTCQVIYYGALLHDLGKVAIPMEILEYPGSLSPSTMNTMRRHVSITESILTGAVDDTVMQVASRHHERLDGSGYPRGLSGGDLDLPARIVAASDVFSALNCSRSYKQPFPKADILEIMTHYQSQGQLDSHVVSLICLHFDDIMASIRERSGPILSIYEGIGREYEALLRRYQHIRPAD